MDGVSDCDGRGWIKAGGVLACTSSGTLLGVVCVRRVRLCVLCCCELSVSVVGGDCVRTNTSCLSCMPSGRLLNGLGVDRFQSGLPVGSLGAPRGLVAAGEAKSGTGSVGARARVRLARFAPPDRGGAAARSPAPSDRRVSTCCAHLSSASVVCSVWIRCCADTSSASRSCSNSTHASQGCNRNSSASRSQSGSVNGAAVCVNGAAVCDSIAPKELRNRTIDFSAANKTTSQRRNSRCEQFFAPVDQLFAALKTKTMAPTLTIAEAASIVLSHTRPLDAEAVPPLEALGRVLARAVVAPWPHPPFPASIKDGFAVRSCDCPCDLSVVAACRAGEVATTPLAAGQAVYITTGAPMPPGADAVVALEEAQVLAHSAAQRPAPPALTSAAGQPTRGHAGAAAGAAAAARVRIARPVRAGAEVRAVGSDIAVGSELLAAGAVVGPAEVGLVVYSIHLDT